MRRGVWQCPQCSIHQIWKAKAGTERLDRSCEHCEKRIRVKLDRSSSGQGRRRSVRIWERGVGVSDSELQQEADRRNSAAYTSEQVPSEVSTDVTSQSTLPNIWGIGWQPDSALEFSNPLKSETARIEFLRFFAERHDGHLEVALSIWDDCEPPNTFDGNSFHEFSADLITALKETLHDRLMTSSLSTVYSDEVMPMRTGELHIERRTARLLIDITLCLRRIAHYSSITLDQRLEWQRMMTRTRVVDEHLKELFSEGLKTPDGGSFTGKGFRSTWQEGIVACASALRRAVDFSDDVESADVVAPMIRDVGLAIAMGQTPTEVFAAQMGKSGSYMDGGHDSAGGRDLHIGNWEKRVLPPTAPLPIASATTTGVALAASRLGVDRFHLAPVGEGCSSSGEFWEAMNLAGTRGLPMAFMIQNNQIALDTYVIGQSGAETFGDKGHAMGIPSWTIDGSDPGLFYASTATAREFASGGGGSTLIHVETMRGCGHAHHHDDLYLGASSGNPPGYVDRGLLSYWSDKDPLPNHRELLVHLGCDESVLEQMEVEENALADASREEMENMPWPEGNSVTKGITSLHDASSHSEQFSRFSESREPMDAPLPPGDVSLEFSDAANSSSYSRAIQNAMASIADESGDSVVFMGEDMEVAGAFGMNLPLKAKGHSDKLLDMPLSELSLIHI